MILLVLDVWLGVVARYLLPFQVSFTEELARSPATFVARIAHPGPHRADRGVGPTTARIGR